VGEDFDDEIRLQRDCSMLAHQAHPVGEAGRAERLIGLIGIVGRQLPQALLPPHTADKQPRRRAAEMRGGPLLRRPTPDIAGYGRSWYNYVKGHNRKIISASTTWSGSTRSTWIRRDQWFYRREAATKATNAPSDGPVSAQWRP
jgi:hypothetical protein